MRCKGSNEICEGRNAASQDYTACPLLLHGSDTTKSRYDVSFFDGVAAGSELHGEVKFSHRASTTTCVNACRHRIRYSSLYQVLFN